MCAEFIGVTIFFLVIGMARIGYFFYDDSLMKMKESLLGITFLARAEQANVLDSLPDGIIITDKDKPTYLNEEALKLLNCEADINEVRKLDDLSSLTCVDKVTGARVPVSEQLINVLAAVDNRIASIEKGKVFETIIEKATDKAELI